MTSFFERTKLSMKHACRARGEAGFTLIELLVSISIFAIITTVAVFNHTQFNGSVLLTNLAYDVALSARQAQFYGTTVKRATVDLADTSRFDSGYGIRFDTSTPTSYFIFEDARSGGVGTLPNHVYDSGDVKIETFYVQKGNKITKICLDNDCSPTSVDTTFVRPNPDAFIKSGSASYNSKAEICVTSPAGQARKVVIESTGQISVSADGTNICGS